MKPLNGYPSVVTDEDRREMTSHGDAAYPFAYYYEDIWEFDFHSIDWHWHPEVEFLYVKRGSLVVLIGSEKFRLEQGEGLFINSRVLHRFEAEESMALPNIVFSTELLAKWDSLMYRKYVSPVINQTEQYQILRQCVCWQNKILEELKSVFELQESMEDCEWETVQHLMRMWQELYENAPRVYEWEQQAVGKQARLQLMLQYMQDNIREPVTLEEVAASGMISKSSAQKLFAQYLHTSPIEYLIRYRLQQATKLLTSTEKTVTEISQEVGFREIAYFCQKFKALYQMTPTKYRHVNEDRLQNPQL